MNKEREIIENEIKRLEYFLTQKPDMEIYTGDGDTGLTGSTGAGIQGATGSVGSTGLNGEEWVDMENDQNDRLEEDIKRRIEKLKKRLSNLTNRGE